MQRRAPSPRVRRRRAQVVLVGLTVFAVAGVAWAAAESSGAPKNSAGRGGAGAKAAPASGRAGQSGASGGSGGSLGAGAGAALLPAGTGDPKTQPGSDRVHPARPGALRRRGEQPAR